MQPVYRQIVSQIKDKIVHGELTEETVLPSIRILSKDINVSALTVKKAYDQLNKEGFILTVHGKGSYVIYVSQEQMLEKKKKVKSEFKQTICKARNCGMEEKEIIKEFFKILREDT